MDNQLKVGDLVRISTSLFRNRWYTIDSIGDGWAKIKDCPNIFKAPTKLINPKELTLITKAEIIIYK